MMYKVDIQIGHSYLKKFFISRYTLGKILLLKPKIRRNSRVILRYQVGTTWYSSNYKLVLKVNIPHDEPLDSGFGSAVAIAKNPTKAKTLKKDEKRT